MKILLSNDDGINAEGLSALQETTHHWGEVFVVAPAFNQSTTSHALSLHKPLRVAILGKQKFAVNGKPVDCVHMALTSLLKNRPDIVISGVNHGPNLGQDVYYSGTVAAAREAAISGIPAVAISLALPFHLRKNEKCHYKAAAKAGLMATKKVLQRLGNGVVKNGLKHWPKNMVLNINVPNLPISKLKGFVWASQGRQIYGGKALKRKDHRGQDYYWIGGMHKGFQAIKGSDCYVVNQGYVSLTPLRLDCTDYDFMAGFDETMK